MVMYLILFIIKKHKTKITFPFISKESYFIFKVIESSFYFWFKKRAIFKFFLCISNEVVPLAALRIDIRNLLLRSLVFGLLCYNLRLRSVLEMSEKAS